MKLNEVLRQCREGIEVKNDAEAQIHNTQKSLTEHKDALPQETQDEITTTIAGQNLIHRLLLSVLRSPVIFARGRAGEVTQ